MHKEFQLGPGVYVTDFRGDCQLKGIGSTPESPAPKDIGLILDRVQANENKIEQLVFSIGAMREEGGWEEDFVLIEAIYQNYKLISKFSLQMKEWIVQLSSLNYKPQSDKIEKLIDAIRISDRQIQIQKCFIQFRREFGHLFEKKQQNSQKQAMKVQVQVSEGSEDQNKQKQLKESLGGQNVDEQKQSTYQSNKEQGVYL